MLNKRVMTIILVALVALGIGLWLGSSCNRPQGDISKQLKVATLLPSPKGLNEFSLRKTDGTVLNNKSLEGHWTLLFFGYTNCGDICSTTMTALNQTYTQLEKNKITLPQVIFVSIDPKRDSLAKVKKYVTSFNPNFIGATAKTAILSQLTKQLGVVYVTVKQANDAQIDNSGTLYLVDPNAKLYAVFSVPHDANKITTDLAKIFDHVSKMPVDLAHE